jgi:serine phosphatase RsbU (regulator of sigma subunit)
VGTKDGIYRVFKNRDSISFVKDTILNEYLPKGINHIYKVYQDPKSNIWLSFENSLSGWNMAVLMPEDPNKFKFVSKPFLSLEDFSSTDAVFSDDGENIWFSKANKLFYFNTIKGFKSGEFSSLIRKVTVDEDSVIYNGAYPFQNEDGSYSLVSKQSKDMIPAIKYSDNNIEFRWSAPYFEKEDKLEYSFYLEGFSKDWSGWEPVLYQDFTNLPHNNYTLRIKARNVYNDESFEDSFSFVILRPWYLTFVAFLLYFIAAIATVYLIIILYTRRLKNENIRLEAIIQDRTAEIRKQKEELTDSIEYASRIQRAMLPPEEMLNKHNIDHFILFKPRDIVSGDFYWFGSNENNFFIVAADCTGHGVPGAFMSMLGISFLDEIVIKSGVSDTGKILDALRNHVITSLRQTGKSMAESTKDGMDLSMIAIDMNSKSIQYSGAYNPLYAIRELTEEEKSRIEKDKELELERGSLHNDSHILLQFKADLMPIGISEKTNNFSTTIIEETNSTVYLFSDGFVDQFGGPSGKKFMSKNFKKLLLDIQGLSMEKQRQKLDESLLEWMDDVSQIDDILIIGIRL